MGLGQVFPKALRTHIFKAFGPKDHIIRVLKEVDQGSIRVLRPHIGFGV